ncbi:hypothetical protein PRZ48_003114 [Zasmidium cellare]|uniref:Extracellular serine-rich protein n=1 Tax=Zasmidium cellare TaxID=395010 RepID=A0ABR0EVD9_ZASCE|nr:hypothetical protein PRZ48_003114 [Zasmidium cellare]
MASTTIATALSLLLGVTAAQRVHVIDVGGADLVYSPNAIFAGIGDLVSFNFLQKNHTVVESSFANPCVPLDDGIFADFHVGGSGSFTIELKDTKPHWLYCAQAKHCQAGMVAVINPPADPTKTQCTFAQLAAKAPANVPGKTIQGGTFTPNDPAPANCSNSTSTTNLTSTTTTLSTSTSTTSSSSSSPSITAGNSGDSVILALKNDNTAEGDAASSSDFTLQVTIPLDNKPFSSNPLPNNLTTLSLVAANGATTLDKIVCSAVVGGKIVGLATANSDADISNKEAPVLVTAVQCGVLSSSGSSSVSAASTTTTGAAAISTPVATTMITFTKTADCSSTAPAATSTGSVSSAPGATARLAFSNDLEDTTTQQDVPLTGNPISLNEVLTSISVVPPSVSNVICDVSGQWGASLGDVTSAATLNIEKDGKATWVTTVTCGTETQSNDK